MNDFRKENYIKAWKDDVLQLYNVMWYVPYSYDGKVADIRFAWLNARETRQRRLEEAKAPKPAPTANGDRPRWLGTQVSAVRDEPSQSPLHSRPPTPEQDEKNEQSKDRLELSKSLFEAMLSQSDTPPPPPIEDKEKKEEVVVDKDPGIRTSQLVKMGVLPVDVAYWGVMETMKSERGEGGMDEFRMGLEGLDGLDEL
jgi:hypothetical protein